jgi:hypothetical protein
MSSPFLSDFAGPVVPQDSPGVYPEDDITLPWAVAPQATWLDYRCWVEVHLDAGMALHKPLPQSNPAADTLASDFIDDPNMDKNKTEGTNVVSRSTAKDYVQRMASSTYRFILRGWGQRMGYQVPIPGLHLVGNVTPVPDEIQRAYNVIVGAAMGIPIWFAAWELHYVVPNVPNMPSTGLNAQAPVPFNPALHVRPDAKLPQSIRLPRTVSVAAAQQAAQRAVPNPNLGRVR